MTKKHIFPILVVALFILASCEKDLEKYPLDRPSDQTYLSSKAEMEMAITSCYNSL